jgi:hypothetical protein
MTKLSDLRTKLIAAYKRDAGYIFPFSEFSYVHSDHIRQCMDIDKLRKTVNGWPDIDVLEHSDIHQGFKLWDLAIGVPRDGKPLAIGPSAPALNINTDLNGLRLALNHVGRIGDIVLTPTHPDIVDLTTLSHGWELIDLAHAVAHLRSDPYNGKVFKVWHKNPVQKEFYRALTDLTLGFKLDTAVNMTPDRDALGSCGLPLLMISTQNVLDPNRLEASVPVSNLYTPKPNTALVVVFAALRICPMPYEILTGSTEGLNMSDVWSGLPSMVVFYGWQFVDIITHWPIVDRSGKGDIAYMNYVAMAEDLLPMSLLPEYISATSQVCDIIAPKLSVWLDSDQPINLLQRCNPLPCKCCMRINPKTELAPVRPWSYVKPGTKEEFIPKVWKDYDSFHDNAITALKPGTLRKYKVRFGDGLSLEMRTRKRGHKTMLETIKNMDTLHRIEGKRRRGKQLTTKERAFYLAHRKTQ